MVGNGTVAEDVTDIHISGGTLEAVGSEGGSGIGGGSYNHGNVSDISISGVKDATIEGSYMAAAIGNGAPAMDWNPESTSYGTVSNITIKDSDVTLKVSSGGVGIGANYKSDLDDGAIAITGSSDVTIKKVDNSPTIKNIYHIDGSNFIGTASCYGANADRTDYIGLPGSETDVTAPCEGKITYVNEDGSIEKVISGHGHTWGEWETVKQPTTTETGLRQRVCGVCGKVEQEKLPMLETADEGTPVTDEDLWVTTLDGALQKYGVRQNGTERIYTSDFDSGILTGRMKTLQKLAEDGVEVITFVTNQNTSSFRVDALLSAAHDGQLALRHETGAAPVLTVNGTEQSTLLF